MDTPNAANYLARAKEFLKGRRVLRAAPLALLAVTALHAAPTFSAPNSTSVSDCSTSGGSSTVSPLSGFLINNTHGVSLGGGGRQVLSGGSDCLRMQWSGTGSGTFDGSTLPLSWAFTIANSTPANATVGSWNMTVTLNSTPTTINCSGNCSGGSITGSGSVATPGGGSTLSTWSVQLQVNTAWTGASTITVSVPSLTSIDLNPPFVVVGPSGVPAVSNTVLALLAGALLAMGAAYLRRPDFGSPLQ